MNGMRKLNCFILIPLCLFSGCLPQPPDKIDASQLFDLLDAKNISVRPANEVALFDLSNASPPFQPVGVYQTKEIAWALFDLPAGFSHEASLHTASNFNLHIVSKSELDSDLVASLKSLSPMLGFEQLGIFLYPLGLCFLVALFVSSERMIALRRSQTFPRKVELALYKGEFPDKVWEGGSAAERIVQVAIHENASEETIRAYARLEISAMERGLFLLEVVVAAAPLIGLLGTVTGLVEVFSQVHAVGNIDKSLFSQGISLALLTTMTGLAIALPAIFLNSYLLRVLDKRSAALDWLTARLLEATASDANMPEIKR